METVLDVIGALFGVYFVIAMLMYFHWFYFRKGSWKKPLMHVAFSVLGLTAVVGVAMIRGHQLNAELVAERDARVPAAVAIDPALLEVLAAGQAPESIDPDTVASIAALADQRLDEAGKQHIATIKQYFIYYHSELAPEKQHAIMLGTEFEARRRTAERLP